jgi:hypothetical protein
MDFTEFETLVHQGKTFQEIQHIARKKYRQIYPKSFFLSRYLDRISEYGEDLKIERILKIAPTRSNSGELEVSTIMPANSISCSFDCAMCPDERIQNGATKDMPRSYLSSEGTPKLGELDHLSDLEEIDPIRIHHGTCH